MRPIAHSLAAIAALILSPFIALAWLVRPQVRQGFAERLGRIEPAEGSAASLLVDGASVILDSVHFLRDGEPVRVVATRELMP